MIRQTSATWVAALAVLGGAASLLAGDLKPAPHGPTRDRFNEPLPKGAVARFGNVTIPTGPQSISSQNYVEALHYSADGKTLVATDRWMTFHVWRTDTGKETAFSGITQPDGRFIDWTPTRNGKQIVASYYDATVYVYDITTGRVVRKFGPDPRANAPQESWVRAAHSFDGKTVAVSVTDGIIRLYDTATGKSPPSLDLGKTTLSLMAFSRDGKRLVTVDRDNAIGVWDAKTGKNLRSFPGPKQAIRELAVSPDGKRLATYDGDLGLTAYVIDSDGKEIPSGKEGSKVEPEKPRTDYVKIWDVEKGRPIRTINAGSGFPFQMEFTPDGKSLFTSRGWPGLVLQAWDAATGKHQRDIARTFRSIGVLRISPDGRTVAVGSSAGGGAVRLWNTATGKEVWSPGVHAGPISTLALSADGRTAFTGGEEGGVRVWETATGKALRQFAGPAVWFDTAERAMSPDGKLFAASAHDDKQPYVEVSDARTGRPLRKLYDHFNWRVVAVRFSPDGKLLAASDCSKTVRLWDPKSGKKVRSMQMPAYQADQLQFTPDGKRLMGFGSGAFCVWDVTTGKTAVTWDPFETGAMARHAEVKPAYPDQAKCTAVSPDGRVVAMGLSLGGDTERDERGQIVLCDAATGKVLRVIAGLNDPPETLAFSPDGKALATGDGRGTVRLWDPATGREVRKFEGHEQRVSGLAFTPDGRLLVSVSRDTTALVWDVSER